jgi:hypothetical protein
MLETKLAIHCSFEYIFLDCSLFFCDFGILDILQNYHFLKGGCILPQQRSYWLSLCCFIKLWLIWECCDIILSIWRVPTYANQLLRRFQWDKLDGRILVIIIIKYFFRQNYYNHYHPILSSEESLPKWLTVAETL